MFVIMETRYGAYDQAVHVIVSVNDIHDTY